MQPMTTAESHNAPATGHFLSQIIEEDLRTGRHSQVVTRFPPEPNGYLHIGHASSICLNFGLARQFGGRCHLRMDDTNPAREERQYIDAIHRDVKWLGFDWGNHEYYASEYFDQLYEWAVALIRAGKAYVDDQSAEQVRETRGTLTAPGTPSPFRDRSVDENLRLFEEMRAGGHPNGAKVLRAKIDMASPNVNLRDPVMYRILHAPHPHVGDKWCIYPMYDWAHGQSDWIEGITHSICTMEFEDHRPLYDWYIDQLAALGLGPAGVAHRPRQYEFARRNVTHTVVSKRKLLALVKEGFVRGWDDPRMPTLAAMRRRGYPPQAIREFWEAVGVARRENVIPVERLEHHVREVLNRTAPRIMAVLNPLKVVIENYPVGQSEELEAINNPEDPSAGTRKVPFARELYIEREDFMENPPAKFFRLAPGREVRLRYAYFIKCVDVIKDAAGQVIELRCTYDPATRGGDAPDGRRVKATLHWVSAPHALDAEVRLYDHLFTPENAEEGEWRANLNPDSEKVIQAARVEPSVRSAAAGFTYQFERIGYFCVDSDTDPAAAKVIFNRTVTLKDTWARVQRKP
jgi:glutaminyl-tRNA synthetase